MLNFTPDPDQPYVGRNAFAHKGGMHVAGVSARPGHVRAHRPGRRRQPPRAPDLRAVGKGHGPRPRPRRRDLPRRRRGRPAGRAGQGARAPRLSLRGRRRLVRAAAAQGDRRIRAAVPARVVAGDRREARRRPRRDRGDDQDLGRRRALCADRRGKRPGERARPRAAATRSSRSIRICATSSWSTSRCGSSTRPRAPGAVTRVLLDASDGDRVWGSIGVSENVIEASWEALVDSLEYGMRVGRRSPKQAASPRVRD